MMGELRWATEYAITNSLRKIESKLTLDVRIWYRVLLRNCKIENNNSLIGTSHHSGVEIGSQFLELFVHLKYFTGVLMQQIGSLCEDTILVISARRECEKVIGWCQNACTVLIVHWECVFDRLLWKSSWFSNNATEWILVVFVRQCYFRSLLLFIFWIKSFPSPLSCQSKPSYLQRQEIMRTKPCFLTSST